MRVVCTVRFYQIVSPFRGGRYRLKEEVQIEKLSLEGTLLGSRSLFLASTTIAERCVAHIHVCGQRGVLPPALSPLCPPDLSSIQLVGFYFSGICVWVSRLLHATYEYQEINQGIYGVCGLRKLLTQPIKYRLLPPWRRGVYSYFGARECNHVFTCAFVFPCLLQERARKMCFASKQLPQG